MKYTKENIIGLKFKDNYNKLFKIESIDGENVIVSYCEHLGEEDEHHTERNNIWHILDGLNIEENGWQVIK